MPTLEDVSSLERHIVLPKDATALSTYSREYVGISLGGDRKVFGQLRREREGRPVRVRRDRTMGEMAFMNHLKHCEAVFVLYDLRSAKLELTVCDFIREGIPGVPHCLL
jgi:hypothetical protein